MTNLHRDVLLEILNIIDFTDDKGKFVKEFEELNYLESVMNLLQKFPKDIQEKIKAIREPNIQAEEIKKHLSPEEYLPELIKVSNEALRGFVKDIEHTLSWDQKEKIAKLFQQ